MKSSSWKMILIALPLFSLFTSASVRADEPDTNAAPDISITSGARYVTVKGDKDKFREDQWMRDGWAGGVEDATYHQTFGKDWTLDLEGRGVFDEDDYKLRLNLTKTDVGFIHAGFTEYRQYFDRTGGFFGSFSPSSFELDHDLHMRIGGIYFDAGLTLPGLPKIVFGYERQFRDGDESLLEWGGVTQGTQTRKIFPSFQNVDETVDIFKVNVDHDIKNVHLADEFRYEWYRNHTWRDDDSIDLNTSVSQPVTVREDYHHDDFYNTFRADSHLNDKVYWSFGYLFNTLDGGGDLSALTPPPLGPFDKNYVTQAINANLDSHVVNLNTLFGPFAGLFVNVGVQAEKTDTHGFTDALLTEPIPPTTTNLIHSSEDKKSVEETLGLRYVKIPYTTLYAEGRWTEQQIDQDERETEDGLTTLGEAFARDTDADIFRQDYRVGFNTSPLQRLNLAGRYRHAIYRNDYDNEVDTEPGYPAFITAQDFTTDELMAKLTLRPCSRFMTAFTYQLTTSDIETSEAGVPLLVPKGSRQSGKYDASIYSVSATVTPLSRLYLTGLFSFQDTRTIAFANDNPSVLTYRGNVYTVIGTAGYSLDKKTDLNVQYTYSRADDFNDNSASGLPLGLANESHGLVVGLERKITDHILARLRYGYYEYTESSNGGIDNYIAHLASASCTVRF
ncbi:MAG TPA: hypothetical protein VL171_02685 [Verrucomicrobiae bacterium]|nr:hypothetical protein [Verrucomicrobiae bacterium]